jgi:hypothetical protein
VPSVTCIISSSPALEEKPSLAAVLDEDIVAPSPVPLFMMKESIVDFPTEPITW